MIRNCLPATMLLIVLGGCSMTQFSSESAETTSTNKVNLETKISQQSTAVFSDPQLQNKSGKTFFHFSEQDPIALSPGDKKEVTVLFSPMYEAVSSLQIALRFDPKQLAISDIMPAEGISPFYQTVDLDKGEVVFVAGVEKGKYGNELSAFSFTITANKTAERVETVVSFIPEDMSALLPDTANTETAVRENLPRLTFSLR